VLISIRIANIDQAPENHDFCFKWEALTVNTLQP